MAATKGRIRWGTSSWSEKTWVGSFYPEGTRPGAMLAWYATRFDTVEADVTYYRVPDERMVRGWRAKLPAGFALAAKFPRSLVHCGKGAQPDGQKVLVDPAGRADAETFLERMGLLEDRAGPLVLQFPYFNKKAFPSREPFLERLDGFLGSLPAGFRYGVEVRNKTWIDERLTDLLRARGVALVWTDLAYLPHPADLARQLDLVTADFAYARLIGDRKKVEEACQGDFSRIVLDQSARLERWARLLDEARQSVPESYVYANNHYAGHGPATIRELAALCGEELEA